MNEGPPEDHKKLFRPSLQQWAQALEQHGQHFLNAEAAFKRTKSEDRDPRPVQEAAALLLNAVGSMLRHEALGEPTPKAAKALGMLMDALSDQSRGVPSPMLKPARRSSPGRPPPSFEQESTRAFVAASVQLLREQGLGVAQAAERVAALFTSEGRSLSATTAFDHHAAVSPGTWTRLQLPDDADERARRVRVMLDLATLRGRAAATPGPEPSPDDAEEAIRTLGRQRGLFE